MSIEFLNALSRHREIMREVGYTLEDISSAAGRLGNDHLSVELSSLAKVVFDNADKIGKDYAEEIHQEMVVAEEASINMVKASMAAISKS